MEQISDLQAGKAGEYLVCADLILNGLIAFPSEQGLPYDVVASYKSKLLKIQVKSTRKHRAMNQRKHHIPTYLFSIGSNGKEKRWNCYDPKNVDLFALVALDTKRIAYLPNKNIKGAINFRIPELRGTYMDEKCFELKQQVLKLKNEKKSATEIAELLKMTKSNVQKYSANFYQPVIDKRSNRYFDYFHLEKALKEMKVL